MIIIFLYSYLFCDIRSIVGQIYELYLSKLVDFWLGRTPPFTSPNATVRFNLDMHPTTKCV